MIGTRTTPHSEPFSKTEKCVDYCIVDATQSLDLWPDVTFRFKVLTHHLYDQPSRQAQQY
jgi:hypothetical protein